MSVKPISSTQFFSENNHTTFPASCLKKRSNTYTKEDLEKVKSEAKFSIIEEDFQVFSRYSPIDRKIKKLNVKTIIRKDLKNIAHCKKTVDVLDSSPKHNYKKRVNSLADERDSLTKKEKNFSTFDKPKKIRNGESFESKFREKERVIESKYFLSNERGKKKNIKNEEAKTVLKGYLVDSDRSKKKPPRNRSKGKGKTRNIKKIAKKESLSASNKNELCRNHSVYIEKRVKFSDTVQEEEISITKRLDLDEEGQESLSESFRITENDEWLDFKDLNKVLKNSDFVEEFKQKMRSSNERLKKIMAKCQGPDCCLTNGQTKISLLKKEDAAEFHPSFHSKYPDEYDYIGETSKSTKKSEEEIFIR